MGLIGVFAWLPIQILIRGAWIHRGDGTLPMRADMLVRGDSIAAIAPVISALPEYQVIDARGKHVYPGIIAIGTPVGLIEIEAIRATRDAAEVGEFTPEAAAYTAFNVDSRVLPTLRANGILYVESVPQGGVIAGRSAVFRLMGRTREQAVVLSSAALHCYPPSLRPWLYAPYEEQKKEVERAHESWKRLDAYFEQAGRWCGGDSLFPSVAFRALCPYLRGEKPVIWHVETAEDIEAVVRFSSRWGLKAAIAGGAEALRVVSLLREHNIPLILIRTHRLPPSEDSPMDYFYALPKSLRDSGITVFLSHDSFWNQRNLAYNAGSAAAYGLSSEEALALITDKPARWLGLSRLGRLEVGYKASFLLVEGDLLDVPRSRILRAWLEGKEVNLSDNPQEQLFHKY
ncbi:MAG: amidohydrolase family protein [Bacteroidia bacterium]|nr:amidohydrolase family protein [Bacteroidia bacterium]